MTINTDLYRAARDHLVAVIGDYDMAVDSFAWPQVSGLFNWATDWFDVVAGRSRPGDDSGSGSRPGDDSGSGSRPGDDSGSGSRPGDDSGSGSRPGDDSGSGDDRTALWIVEQDGSEQKLSFAELAERSDRVATWLRGLGVGKGDRVILMLGNQVELWEAMLAVGKLGAVIMPTTGALGPADLSDRISRGGARFVITNAVDASKFDQVEGDYGRIGVGTRVDGWHRYSDAYDVESAGPFVACTDVGDPQLIYFTSGPRAGPS